MGKNTIIILFTHQPLKASEKIAVTMPKRSSHDKKHMDTTPIHLQYTTYMQGLNGANQLKKIYLCQPKAHKWRHGLYFVLDMSSVNVYIIHK